VLADAKLYCLVNRGTYVNDLPMVVTWKFTRQQSN